MIGDKFLLVFVNDIYQSIGSVLSFFSLLSLVEWYATMWWIFFL